MSFDLNITLPKDIYTEILSVHHQHMIQICFINPGKTYDGKDHRAQGIEPSSKLTTCTNVLPVT